MALGWLTVLKTVPWTQVLGHAPVVAEGARKLWNAVGPRPAEAEPAAPPPAASPTATGGTLEAQRLEAMEHRMATAENMVADLQEQLRTSSGLIKALADQNEALVKGMEALRARAVWLTAGSLAAGLLALGALVVALSGAAA